MGVLLITSWKNDWYTLSNLGEKETPFPQRNVDLSHVVRNLDRSPNIDLMGVGKDYMYGKIESLCFLSTELCHAPFSISVGSMGIVVLDCIGCPNYILLEL